MHMLDNVPFWPPCLFFKCVYRSPDLIFCWSFFLATAELYKYNDAPKYKCFTLVFFCFFIKCVDNSEFSIEYSFCLKHKIYNHYEIINNKIVWNNSASTTRNRRAVVLLQLCVALVCIESESISGESLSTWDFDGTVHCVSICVYEMSNEPTIDCELDWIV